MLSKRNLELLIDWSNQLSTFYPWTKNDDTLVLRLKETLAEHNHREYIDYKYKKTMNRYRLIILSGLMISFLEIAWIILLLKGM